MTMTKLAILLGLDQHLSETTLGRADISRPHVYDLMMILVDCYRDDHR